MSGPVRITRPLLKILDLFLQAHEDGDRELHGWAITKEAHLSGPTVYNNIDRLEDARWITGTWEILPPDANRPRRRLYRLTPNGVVEAKALLARRATADSRSATRRSDLGWTFGCLTGGLL